MKITGKRIVLFGGLAAVIAAALYSFRPQPVPVETAPAAVGPLSVSIEEEGRTRARDRFTVAAPTAGQLERVALRAGDPVTRGQTVAALRLAARLEVVIEALSTDAVQVRPGMPVRLSGWGGEGTLAASVRTVEPAAFTKVSALGIEEQRVNVVADLSGPPGPLGDGYRVEAAIVTWSADAVLKVPASSLFRRAAAGAAAGQAERGAGPVWAVFAVAERRARLRPVEVGHRTAAEVEILGGIAAGERVVLHPANELRDGARVLER